MIVSTFHADRTMLFVLYSFSSVTLKKFNCSGKPYALHLRYIPGVFSCVLSFSNSVCNTTEARINAMWRVEKVVETNFKYERDSVSKFEKFVSGERTAARVADSVEQNAGSLITVTRYASIIIKML